MSCSFNYAGWGYTVRIHGGDVYYCLDGCMHRWFMGSVWMDGRWMHNRQYEMVCIR
jgi:hypothetical protein